MVVGSELHFVPTIVRLLVAGQPMAKRIRSETRMDLRRGDLMKHPKEEQRATRDDLSARTRCKEQAVGVSDLFWELVE